MKKGNEQSWAKYKQPVAQGLPGGLLVSRQQQALPGSKPLLRVALAHFHGTDTADLPSTSDFKLPTRLL